MKRLSIRQNALRCGFLAGIMVVVSAGLEAREIQGTVTDHESKPVQGASVAVVSLPDSAFMTTMVTDSVGRVRFDTGTVDSVLVTVQMFGYEREHRSVAGDFTVSLTPTSTQLQEVVVEAKPEFRTEAGKFVFTPGDLVKEVRTAKDLLVYVPMVNVTGDLIEVMGAPETMIYVNGKPPRGLLSDIRNLIKALPPSCIKRVEIIRERNASVSGSYQGAIINIVMTYPWEGLLGMVEAEAEGHMDFPGLSGKINLYYTKGQWSFACSARCSSWGDNDKNENYYEYRIAEPDGVKSFVNDIHYRKRNTSLGMGLVANYNFTDRSTLGVSVDIGEFGSTKKYLTNTTYTTVTGNEYESRSAVRDTVPFGTPGVNASLFYTLQTDDKGSNLDIVAGYSVGQSYTHTGLYNPRDTLFRKESKYGVFGGGKIEYQHNFSREVQLKVGGVFLDNMRDNALASYENSNRFIYRERMLSMFGEFGFPWRRTSFEFGLRVESEFNRCELRTTGAKFNRNYTAVLPNVSFNWEMPWHGQSLSASISGSVGRPFMSALNPFRIWTTENTYSEGDPYLKNYYYWRGSLNYVCVKNITLRASFVKSTGGQAQITLPDTDGLMVTRYYEVPGDYFMSVAAYYSKRLLYFWDIQTCMDYTYHHAKFVCQDVKFRRIYSGVGVSVKSIFNFSKKYGIFGTLYYSLSSPFKGYNDTRGGWRNLLTIDVSKRWKNCSLSLYLGGLIPDRYADYNFDSDIYVAKYNKTNYCPSFRLEFGYVFGNRRTLFVKQRGTTTTER